MNIDHIADDLSRAYQDGYNAGYADALSEKNVRFATHGVWQDEDAETYWWHIRCSECGHARSMMSTQGKYPNYCEKCGAMMRNRL